MNRTRGVRRVLIGLGLALTAAGGCQTYYGGGTYPSGHYLEHPPSYAPTESPQFPFARELATMQAQAAEAEARGGIGQGGLPPRVPQGGN